MTGCTEGPGEEKLGLRGRERQVGLLQLSSGSRRKHICSVVRAAWGGWGEGAEVRALR